MATTLRSMQSVWQKLDAQRRFRHSWRDLHVRSVTAMNIVVLVLVLLALVLLVAAVAVLVHRDGYGVVPPPRSHRGWDDGVLPFGGRLG